jgi:hypothetical protein
MRIIPLKERRASAWGILDRSKTPRLSGHFASRIPRLGSCIHMQEAPMKLPSLKDFAPRAGAALLGLSALSLSALVLGLLGKGIVWLARARLEHFADGTIDWPRAAIVGLFAVAACWMAFLGAEWTGNAIWSRLGRPRTTQCAS